MSSSHLKTQADKIAKALKAAERGEIPDIRYGEKLVKARGKEYIKFGLVMDGKTVTITMPWALIKAKSEFDLSKQILICMLDKTGDTVH